MPREGFKPSTDGLENHYSSNWATVTYTMQTPWETLHDPQLRSFNYWAFFSASPLQADLTEELLLVPKEGVEPSK